MADEYHRTGLGHRLDPNKLTRDILETGAAIAAGGNGAVARDWAGKWLKAKCTQPGLNAPNPFQVYEGQDLLIRAALHGIEELIGDPQYSSQNLRTLADGLQYEGAPCVVTALPENYLHLWVPVSTYGEDERLQMANDLSVYGEMWAHGMDFAGAWLHPIVLGYRQGDRQASPWVRGFSTVTGTYWCGKWTDRDGREHRLSKPDHVEHSIEDIEAWVTELMAGRIKPTSEMCPQSARDVLLPKPIWVKWDAQKVEEWHFMAVRVENRVAAEYSVATEFVEDADHSNARKNLAGLFPQNYRECLIRGRCPYYEACWDGDMRRCFQKEG